MHVAAATAAACRRPPPAAVLRPSVLRVLPPSRQVEFPDGRSTLCLLPAKFHKKLWICKGSYCIIEEQAAAAEGERRVTGAFAVAPSSAASPPLEGHTGRLSGCDTWFGSLGT